MVELELCMAKPRAALQHTLQRAHATRSVVGGQGSPTKGTTNYSLHH